jgi:Arc/MetJ-type ribon-helix-helix transcriptional regulator
MERSLTVAVEPTHFAFAESLVEAGRFASAMPS